MGPVGHLKQKHVSGSWIQSTSAAWIVTVGIVFRVAELGEGMGRAFIRIFW